MAARPFQFTQLVKINVTKLTALRITAQSFEAALAWVWNASKVGKIILGVMAAHLVCHHGKFCTGKLENVRTKCYSPPRFDWLLLMFANLKASFGVSQRYYCGRHGRNIQTLPAWRSNVLTPFNVMTMTYVLQLKIRLLHGLTFAVDRLEITHGEHNGSAANRTWGNDP